jgi:tetratricopeptide (TPR) repeat protein
MIPSRAAAAVLVLLASARLGANPEPAHPGAENTRQPSAAAQSPAEATPAPESSAAAPVSPAAAAAAAEPAAPSADQIEADVKRTLASVTPPSDSASAAARSSSPDFEGSVSTSPSPSTFGTSSTPTSSNPADGITLSPNTVIEHNQIAHGASPEEIASLLRLGHAKFEKGDYATAEIALLQVLAEHATPDQDHEALLALARTYRKNGDFTKAVAVYERFIKDYPGDPNVPSVYLELGRTLRALGAYKQAIARFYSVLNSTLKLPEDSQDQYRQLARTAQYEIAETYFQTGEYEQANRYFSRLKLLDLAPEDRARAHFKSVYALSLAGENDKAIAGLTSFIAQYPEDENIPEAQYLLSRSLRKVGRTQDSLRATLELLKSRDREGTRDQKRWSYWQRKTGNQLANEFYQAGDFTSAMVIYQSLAQLSSDPAWNLPVLYQTGLCYERLRRFDKARECYETIVGRLKTSATTEAPPKADLSDLAEMAAWRLSQLNWETSTEAQLSALFPSTGPHQPETQNAVSRTASLDHDTDTRTTVASSALR